MKRGRPSKKILIQTEILEIISASSIPVTTAYLTNEISKKLSQKINWNTVRKYAKDLVASDKLQAIDLPHSKKEDKKGLTVYILKK